MQSCRSRAALVAVASITTSAALLLVGLASIPEARAFEQYSIDRNSGNCANCHDNFRTSPYISRSDGQSWGDDLHDVHRQGMLTGDCSTCHNSSGRFPVFLNSSVGGVNLPAISCVGCHGRDEDDGGDPVFEGRGAGLRQHHYNTGITLCVNCHLDSSPANYTPVGEDVLPPYYFTPDTAHPDKPTDPCADAFVAGGIAGLDNDGDVLYDASDPDCASNDPPVADPNGPYTGIVGAAVLFDGSGSTDPDGSIVAYDWDFGNGNTGSGVSPTHTYAAAGLYTVALTVTDDGGLTDSASTTADITSVPNVPPVADPNGPYTGTVGLPVQFDGTGSFDSDGAIAAYDWDFGDGSTGSGPVPTHTYSADGVYTVTLTVTDDDGATDTASTTTDIGVANNPPVADPNGPYTSVVGSPLLFDGSGSSDPDSTIVAYDWDFGDGNAGSGVSPTHTYAAAGLYTVTLTVTDDGGLTDSASTTADISSVPNFPPVADPNGPYTGIVGVPVSFDGSGSTDPDSTIVAYDWDFGDGNTGTGIIPSHVYAAAGLYTITLTVTDDGGLTNSASTTANIGAANNPPMADPGGPYTGSFGMPVLFDGSGSMDPDGTIVAYDWDFGDGGTGTGISPMHTYAAGGIYTVTLTVTDDDGATDSASTTADIVVDSADAVADIVDDPAEIPDSSFSDMGNGHRTGTSSILAAVQRAIDAGRIAQAIKKLNILKAHYDGCDGSVTESADSNDWVTSCDDQRRIRMLIDDLIAYLESLP